MPRPLISIDEARDRVLARVQPLPSERIGLGSALGRVLALDVQATDDVPHFPSSAMDGYAIKAGAAGRALTVVGESRAGHPSDHELTDGEAIRISTGAVVPAGATAVIPQEEVRADNGRIETEAAADAGQHVRAPGEDMRSGATVLTAGTRLGAVALGAAAAAGHGELTVAQRPRVAVLCTGDELVAPGAPLAPGEIHNSNAPMLVALALGRGAAPGEAQRLPDDRAATRRGIEAALAGSDLILISGGVSVGPHDHVKPVLAALGVEEVFWSVSLQPGKPTWFGVAGDGTLVFGLPGNPVSAAVTFSLFAAPALAAQQGTADPREGLEAEAVLAVDVRRNRRREMAIRVRLERGAGPPQVTPNGAQGSHVLTSMIGADALAMIPAGDGVAAAGSTVTLQPLAR